MYVSLSHQNSHHRLIQANTQTKDSDLRQNVYEGGYKTWECSLDLVRYLLDRGPRKDLDDLMRVGHVIEMGCGSDFLLFSYSNTQ